MEEYTWVYLGVSVLVIIIGILLNIFFKKLEKIDILFSKIDVIMERLDNHLTNHISENTRSINRRDYCDSRSETFDKRLRNNEDRIIKLEQKWK